MTDRWQNRRRMAWLALFAGLGYPVLLFAAPNDYLVAVAPHFYLFVGSVVGCYVGFATFDDKWHKTPNGEMK